MTLLTIVIPKDKPFAKEYLWFGHVERSCGAVRTACGIQIDDRRGTGWPKLTWKRLKEKDCCEWKLTTFDPQGKGAPGDQVWDLLCVQLASYLEGGQQMWMMPLHLHINQKFDYDMIWNFLQKRHPATLHYVIINQAWHWQLALSLSIQLGHSKR